MRSRDSACCGDVAHGGESRLGFQVPRCTAVELRSSRPAPGRVSTPTATCASRRGGDPRAASGRPSVGLRHVFLNPASHGQVGERTRLTPTRGPVTRSRAGPRPAAAGLICCQAPRRLTDAKPVRRPRMLGATRDRPGLVAPASVEIRLKPKKRSAASAGCSVLRNRRIAARPWLPAEAPARHRYTPTTEVSGAAAAS